MGQRPWVRFRKAYAEEVGLSEGATVEIKVSGPNLVLAPAWCPAVAACCSTWRATGYAGQEASCIELGWANQVA